MCCPSGSSRLYGPSHWTAIAVFVVGAVLVIWLGRRQSDHQSRIFGRILGALTAAIYVAMLAYTLVPPSIERSVPLRLTDLATVVGAYALWSQRQWAFVLTYYWGLVLSTQALISPVLKSPDFPHYEFLAFWSIHLLVVWAAIYLTWGRGMRPDWGSYRLRGAGDGGVGRGHHGVQRNRGDQLWLPQRQTLHRVACSI